MLFVEQVASPHRDGELRTRSVEVDLGQRDPGVDDERLVALGLLYDI